MQLGMTLAEYEHSVGPKNQLFHEIAEAQYLVRAGIIRADEDGTSSSNDKPTLTDVADGTEARWSSKDSRTDTPDA